MLGHKLIQVLRKGSDVWTTIRGTFESVDRFCIFERNRTVEGMHVGELEKIKATVESIKPDVVINAVGIIKQLPSSKDVITTLRVNSIFPHRLAELAAEFAFRLICISTDCVFDGQKGNYIEEDVPNAVDLYGKSKHLGEVVSNNCLTMRTSIIGRELQTSHSLVEWFLRNDGSRVNGFINAIYSGFPTLVLADIISDLIFNRPELNGLYHVSSEPIDKYNLLQLLKRHYKVNIAIERFDDFKIDRSLDSTRFRSATGFAPASWDEMINRLANDPTPYDKWRR